MALIKGFKDFQAFKDAYALALEIRPLTKNMDKTEQFGGIADQLRRASTGVCANLAEGFGKNQSKAELRRFVRMAMGSAHEMDFWLNFAKDCGQMEKEQSLDIANRYDKIGRMLKAFEISISPNENQTPNTKHQTLP